MAWNDWIPSLTTATVFSGVWIAVLYLARTRWEKALQAKFDAKLETVKSDLRREEDGIKASIKASEDKLAALRSGALANMAQREAELAKRRQQALEKLWSSVIEHAPYKAAAKMSESLHLDAIITAAAGYGKEADGTRELAAFTLKISGLEKLEPLQIKSDLDRPFIPSGVWAMYKAYRSVVVNSAIKLLAAKSGVDPKLLLPDDGLIKIAVAALPHHAPSFEKFGGSFLSFIPDEMEEKLLKMITDALNGVEQDAAAVANAKAILTEVTKREAEIESVRVSIPAEFKA